MVTEAKRRANNRWDAKNTHFFGVKMPNREADALKRACQAEGITPHAFFLRAAREYLRTANANGDEGDGPSAD